MALLTSIILVPAFFKSRASLELCWVDCSHPSCSINPKLWLLLSPSSITRLSCIFHLLDFCWTLLSAHDLCSVLWLLRVYIILILFSFHFNGVQKGEEITFLGLLSWTGSPLTSFWSLLIHQYLLNTYYIPGAGLGTRDTNWNQIQFFRCRSSVSRSRRRQMFNK